MAYDSYRRMSGRLYPYFYDNDDFSQTHSSSDLYQRSNSDAPAASFPPKSRLRSSSNVHIDSLQPVDFKSDSLIAGVDPSLVAQITDQVRRQVIGEIKDTSSKAESSSHRRPFMLRHSASPSMLPSMASSLPRHAYTPPSPSRRSSSPESSYEERNFYGSEKGRVPSRYKSHYPSNSVDDRHLQHKSKRPLKVGKFDDDGELESISQPLFDEKGCPTKRLCHFLRGLAFYIIEDIEPKGSLVITPKKMLQFYTHCEVPDEPYPWSTVFGKLTNQAISKIYRDLRCNYHLTQKSVDKAPNVPGLTPSGFQNWMTIFILAHPDVEFERLSKAAIDMSTNSPDLSPVKLPYQLFPKKGNQQIRQQCVDALAADGNTSMTKAIASQSHAPQPPSLSGTYPRSRSSGLPVASNESADESLTFDRDEIQYSVPPRRKKTFGEGGRKNAGARKSKLNLNTGVRSNVAPGRPASDRGDYHDISAPKSAMSRWSRKTPSKAKLARHPRPLSRRPLSRNRANSYSSVGDGPDTYYPVNGYYSDEDMRNYTTDAASGMRTRRPRKFDDKDVETIGKKGPRRKASRYYDNMYLDEYGDDYGYEGYSSSPARRYDMADSRRRD